MRDLAAIEGELVTVAGRAVNAHVELGAGSQTASDFGADERIDIASASFEWSGPEIRYDDPVRARGKNWSITEIDITAGNLVTLSLEHDR
jgi:hypothetical protein